MRNYSYQLYSSRKFPPLAATLAMVAEIGYREVEGYGALFVDLDAAKALKAIMPDTLAMPSAHFPLSLIEGDPDEALRIADLLGVRSVYVPFIAQEDRPTDGPGWRAFGERLARAGRRVVGSGRVFGWHNHDFEMERLADGQLVLDHLIASAPDLSLELDLAWVRMGGADPVAMIRRYADRISSIHIKDIAASDKNADEDGWSDVGDGVMPWAEISVALAGAAIRHFVIEHDNPGDDRRFATRSLAAAHRLLEG